MPIKPLTFKGDKKSSSKKRKHADITSSASLIPSAASKFNTTNTTTATSTTNPHVPPSEDDSWTSPHVPSDLNGPTLIALPTDPPTCLASDANGNVFASLLENMIDSDPRTAEPHDVRQVWVASKIAGMGEGEIGFKGAHGGWLACDQYGILGARREARGVEEVFIVEKAESQFDTSEDNGRRGTWRAKTAARKKDAPHYLSAIVERSKDSSTDDTDDSTPRKRISISLRGDGTLPPSQDQSHDTTLLHLKMQTRFLPRSAATQAASARHEKVSRRELEAAVGRKLEDDEVRRLKRKKREGDGYMEEVLDLRSKGKHDKFA